MRKDVQFALYSLGVCLVLLQFPTGARAQEENEVIVPAGTLLHCTLDEPDFSSKTAEIGDPVICQLNGVSLFGRSAVPRGSYLGGHLEADKEPGHFFGKGYLKLEFDYMGVPDGQIPVPAKIIAARGFRVDKEGDIEGHGHAVRDAVEWMFPPLWPIKLLMLPARGPRPELKREEALTLRLMDDAAIPLVGQSQGRNAGRPSASAAYPPSRPAAPAPNPAAQPAANSAAQYSMNRPLDDSPNRTYLFPNEHFPVRAPVAPWQGETQPAVAARTPVAAGAPQGAAVPKNLLVLRNGSTYSANALRVDGHMLHYALSDGTTYAVPLDVVDWTKTFQANAQNGVTVTLNSDEASQ